MKDDLPQLTGGTLFSGIGAPEMAAPFVRWAWSADIDAFANAVRAAHWPETPNMGDVLRLDHEQLEAIDLLVFGSPCQSFSAAGKRGGLDDPRGGLALAALDLVARLRPPWFVFENVPGLLSNRGGASFRAFLEAVHERGYSGCWRVLDARYFGLPLSRARLFFVGHSGGWRGPAAVLFERGSLRGHAQEGGAEALSSHNQGGPDPGRGPLVFNLRGREGGSRPEASRLISLRAASGGASRSFVVADGWARRITPREAERALGFPDGHTGITWRGRPAPDGLRLKATGNSMSVPVMRWLLARVALIAGGRHE